jgi:hypothetical protein
LVLLRRKKSKSKKRNQETLQRMNTSDWSRHPLSICWDLLPSLPRLILGSLLLLGLIAWIHESVWSPWLRYAQRQRRPAASLPRTDTGLFDRARQRVLDQVQEKHEQQTLRLRHRHRQQRAAGESAEPEPDSAPNAPPRYSGPEETEQKEVEQKEVEQKEVEEAAEEPRSENRQVDRHRRIRLEQDRAFQRALLADQAREAAAARQAAERHARLEQFLRFSDRFAAVAAPSAPAAVEAGHMQLQIRFPRGGRIFLGLKPAEFTVEDLLDLVRWYLMLPASVHDRESDPRQWAALASAESSCLLPAPRPDEIRLVGATLLAPGGGGVRIQRTNDAAPSSVNLFEAGLDPSRVGRSVALFVELQTAEDRSRP